MRCPPRSSSLIFEFWTVRNLNGVLGLATKHWTNKVRPVQQYLEFLELLFNNARDNHDLQLVTQTLFAIWAMKKLASRASQARI
jgi:hypothetical protein